MLPAHDLEEAIEIVQVLSEIPHVAAPSPGATVTAVIVAMDGAPPRCEPGAEALIATAVLCVTMNDEKNAPRLRRQPSAAEQPQPIESREV
jgi:hypothetical protein